MLPYLKNHDRYRSENLYTTVFNGYYHYSYQIPEKNIAYWGNYLHIGPGWTLGFSLFEFDTGSARGRFILLRARI